jgi:hypothetical protein
MYLVRTESEDRYSLFGRHFLVSLRLQKVCLPEALPRNLQFSGYSYSSIPPFSPRTQFFSAGALSYDYSMYRVQTCELRYEMGNIRQRYQRGAGTDLL